MKTIYLLLIGFVFLGLTACNKDLGPRIIKGRMMYDCGIPAVNSEFVVENMNPSMIGNGDFRENFKTDSLGYFEVIFYPKNSDKIEIGPGILNSIPLPKAKEKFDLGNVYCNFTYKTVVRLNVTKPYTENDTLYYASEFQDSWNKLAGPFHSGIIDTLTHIKLGDFSYNTELNGYSEQAIFTLVSSDGEILLRGLENGNGVLNVPKISDACENGTMGEEIYNIRRFKCRQVITCGS